MSRLADMSDSRRGLQALIDETLAGPAASFGYVRREITFARSIDIVLRKSQAAFVVWLKPHDEDTAAYRQTAHFKVGHRGDPPDRQGYAVIDALVERLREWERSLRAAETAELFAPASASPTGHTDWLPFFEWLAVRTGLKPASRHVAAAASAERLLEAARADGLRAIAEPAGDFVSSFLTDHRGSDTIVYAARTDAELTAVVAAERAMMEICARGELPGAEHVRALGTALGYPPCCIEAFIPIRDLSNAEIRFHALRSTGPSASWLLNQAIDGRVLVAYAMCRCDCAPSIAYGRALLDEVAKHNPQGAAELERALRGLMILFADGSAFRLPLDTAAVPPLYPYARFEGAGQGVAFERWNDVLGQGDRIEVADGGVRVLRGASEIARLAAPPDQVQMRRFS
jgi:hypothetical protein